MNMIRVFLFASLIATVPSLALGQAWQVPANTIPYGKGPGQNNFGSVANTGSGTLCLLNTTPPSFGTCSGSLPALNSGRIFVGNASNVAVAVVLSGDCTLVAAGAITCTKTNGVAFGTMAVQNATAVAITGGTFSNGTFTAGAFNGTLGATTPSTVRATGVGVGVASSASLLINATGADASGSIANISTTNSAALSGFNVRNDTSANIDLLSFGTAAASTNFGLSRANMSTISSVGSTVTTIGTTDAVPLVLGTSDSERMRILSGGNTGFGTSTPTFSNDAAIGNIVAASGQGAGVNKVASIGAGGNITGTANAAGEFAVFNSAVVGVEKRLASFGAVTEGATNSGAAYIATYSGAVPTVWTTLSHLGLLIHTGTLRLSGIPAFSTPGCLANDASGNISGGNACSGGGMPVAGARSQVPLNSAAGAALWRTEPFVNISGLTGADCTGAVATVISTVMSTNKAVALPTDCLLKVTGNDTIPAGTFLAVPCGARIQVDGAAILVFNAETDDSTCQKFTASGAGAGSGGGIVRGLRFNRPEWWGAFGDCDYIATTCTHDDSGPLQQAFNSAFAATASSGGNRPHVKFGCEKGYGVGTGVNALTSSEIQLEISGCGSIHSVAGQGGSAIIGQAGFVGSVLTVKMFGAGPDNIDFYLHDFGVYSINAVSTDTCLQIGAAGQNMANGAGRSLIENLRIENCKHSIKYAGQIVTLKHNRIWMVMPSTGASTCIEAVPSGTDDLSEFTFDTVACVSNSNASSISYNIHPTGSTFAITGWRFNDTGCYSATMCYLFQADSSSVIADVWINSAQADAMLVNGAAFSLITTGTGQIVDVVFNQSYTTNTGAIFHGYNIDGSAGGTISNIGIYGAYMATGSTLRGMRITDASQVQVQGARIGGSYVNQGILLNNCTGCLANNNIFSGTVPFFILLGSSTDFSQACNNTASGALAPSAVSASSAAGTHNIFFASGYQSCPNN